VRKFGLSIILFIGLSSLLASAGTTFKATTTLAAETSNNTSAANSFATQTNGNIGATNISKAPTRNLLYSGSTAKIYAHFVPWFGFGDHMNVGYVSSDTVQVTKQVNDMVSRGLDGAVIDWYGRGESSAHFLSYDHAAQAFMAQAELHPGFTFAIMHDAGALKTCAATAGCDVTATLIADLNYVNVTYAGSTAYLHSAGRPVIYFFGHEAYAIDWTRVTAGVAGNPMFIFRNGSGFTRADTSGAFSWADPINVSATNLMSLAYLDSYYKSALGSPTKYSTGSAYKGFNDTLAAWGTDRIIGQQCGQTWLSTLTEAGKYYTATKQMLGIQLVTWNDYEEGTEIESGIDNCVTVSASVTGTVVSWGITGQMNTVDHFSVYASQDGANLMWLADEPTTVKSLDLAPFGFNAGNYTMFVKAVGKPSLTNKMSAGVELTVTNQPPSAALAVSTPLGNAPTSGALVVPATVTASAAASVDVDGKIVATSISFGDGSAVVNAVSASHTYTKAGTFTVTATVTDNLGAVASKSIAVIVGPSPSQPLAAAITATPGSGYAPSTVSISSAGSTGSIASTLLSFGDGTTASGPTASHQYSAAGLYTVTAKVTGTSGATSTASTKITIKAPEVIIASPTAASVASSMHVVASGFSGFPVTAMQVYVDSKLMYSAHVASMDTTLALTSGAHALIVKGWDTAGESFSKTMAVTVAGTATAPSSTQVSVASQSVLVGASVVPVTLKLGNPNIPVRSAAINFGDGTTASSITTAHQFTKAGTYLVRATVVNSQGIPSSAMATIVVKPQSVAISSPAPNTTTPAASVHVAGTGSSGYKLMAMHIYVDNVLKYRTAGGKANAVLALTPGRHHIVVQGWDITGATFKSSVIVTKISGS
jgi:PKD repeat protein